MSDPRIAYFSMEIALAEEIPTYSGGLGVLAGDTIRAAADLKVPMVAVSLLHRRGYFRQTLDDAGRQHEAPEDWPVASILPEEKPRVAVTIEGRTVHLRAWRFAALGAGGFTVPVYLLDADLPENSEPDRRLTDTLYGGDERYRLSQEVILGIGGVRMLQALGHAGISRYHMNEGHAALLTIELLQQRLGDRPLARASERDIAAVREQCIFTTHTPVPAGHDQFTMELAGKVLERNLAKKWPALCFYEGRLNMTYLALNFSRYVNGVARRHGEVSQAMFSNFAIDWITNGVHAGYWAAPPIAELFDRYISGWREDQFSLRHAASIPGGELWQAHMQAKQRLIDHLNQQTGAGMEPEALTLGFARRATAYKRHDLLLHDIGRLQELARRHGPMQIIFAGKAHPRDQEGKDLIRRIVELGRRLGDGLRLVYLPGYDMKLARVLLAGVDVWLNTPLPPMEASGTSGMKAAVNGVPSLSVPDGWWIEGCIEGVTGWNVGAPSTAKTAATAAALYAKLDEQVLPTFYQRRDHFIEIMRQAVTINGSYFNTHRMVQQYVSKAYFA